MKRLVYRPKVWAYVKAMGGGQPIDLSPYLVNGRVSRVIDDVSTASLTFRNPDFKFTTDPTFHPMDPITIFMARNSDYPVRVFTGFLDDTPYVQLFPGTATITASCTMKRLKYTYWDPALPFSTYFLSKYGWYTNLSDGTMTNLSAEAEILREANINSEVHLSSGLNDSGLSNLISSTMQAVGHWDPKDLLIEPLPSSLTNDIDKLWSDLKGERNATQDALKSFLQKAIGDPPQNVAGGSSPSPPFAAGLSSSDGAGLTQVNTGESYKDPTRGTFQIDSNNAKNLVWWSKGQIAIAKWMAPQLVWAKSNGWDGNLVTGFRTYAHQKAIYDSGTVIAAVPGLSNHEGSTLPRGAIDAANPEQLFTTLSKYKGVNRLVWAESVNFADHPHFSHTGH